MELGSHGWVGVQETTSSNRFKSPFGLLRVSVVGQVLYDKTSFARDEALRLWPQGRRETGALVQPILVSWVGSFAGQSVWFAR